MRRELIKRSQYVEPEMPQGGVKIAVGCFDWRLREAFMAFFQWIIKSDNFVRMNFPGGAKLINDPIANDYVIHEFFASQLIERGDLEGYILDHSGCLAWGGSAVFSEMMEERKFHFNQLRNSRMNLNRSFPGRKLNIHLYYAEFFVENGQGFLRYIEVDTEEVILVVEFTMPQTHITEKIVVGSFSWKTRRAFIDFMSDHLETECFFRLNFREGSKLINDRCGRLLVPYFFDTPIKKCGTREILLLDQSGRPESIHMDGEQEFQFYGEQLLSAKAHLMRGYKDWQVMVNTVYAEICSGYIDYWRVLED